MPFLTRSSTSLLQFPLLGISIRAPHQDASKNITPSQRCNVMHDAPVSSLFNRRFKSPSAPFSRTTFQTDRKYLLQQVTSSGILSVAATKGSLHMQRFLLVLALVGTAV